MEKGRVLDLFAGIGGMTLAAEKAGLSVVCAVGDSKQDAGIYESNFGNKPYICEDCETIDISGLPDADYILCKLPAQPLSVAYLQKEIPDKKEAFVQNVIVQKRPKAFLVVVAGKGGKVLKAMSEFAEDVGYHFWYQMLDSKRVTGMPVYESCTYMVGIRRDIGSGFHFSPVTEPYVYPIADIMVAKAEAYDSDLSAGMRVKIKLDGEAKVYNYDRKGKEGRTEGCYMKDESIRYHLYYPALLWDGNDVRKIRIRELARTKFFPDAFSYAGSSYNYLYGALVRSVNVGVVQELIRCVCREVECRGDDMSLPREDSWSKIEINGREGAEPVQRKQDAGSNEPIEKKAEVVLPDPEKPTSQEKPTHTRQSSKRIFLSYCQRDSDVADLIEKTLTPYICRDYHISRDIRDVAYKQSFRKFMESIQDHEYVLMIISDRYMKSLNCMFEMMEVFKDSNYGKRLLFFVLSRNDEKYYKKLTEEPVEAEIYSIKGRAGYKLYWQEQQNQVSSLIKQIGEPMYTRELVDEKIQMERIKLDLDDFFKYMMDAKGLSLDEHLATDFRELRKFIYGDEWDMQ